MAKTRIAVPSNSPGGLEAERSAHFGRCDVFTLVDVNQDGIAGVKIVSNIDHTEGGCLVPVNLLADHQVDIIIVNGMGMRPLLGFQQAGIKVLLSSGHTVQEAIDNYLAGRIQPMTERNVCGGH
ncbi:MAG: dinitrogenase iron-molybdenum cofactor biosynthesis protein [Clostridia bacterium]|jgi:predicted Fe-Mo cluster-binding NifX family protein|nr:dinitrogenase iron-molybdenum cofactor biosynthesis protein [Clostridia bacterium]